ncbi:MAG TPA: hypothetical protein VF331_01435 [Polyangiales bacterium]
MNRPLRRARGRLHDNVALWAQLVALCCALPLCLTGCAVLAGKADYADYRAVRLSHDDASRLLAMQRYVQRHPDGQWHVSIQAERERRDVATFESGKATATGLSHYLRVFPDGVFSAQARSRLSAIALIEGRKHAELARARQLTEARKQREVELSRTWVTRFIGYWAKTLGGLSSWGAPIPEVAHDNPAFSRAFGAEPRPRCTLDECVKYYASHYAVPVPGGTRVERTLSLLLRLRMRDGKLERAELLLPDQGFSRWFEIEERKAVVDGDPLARHAAVAWAEKVLVPLLAIAGSDIAEGPGGYVLAPIERPAIGPSGELTDTTAEDPSAPRNRLGGVAADGTTLAGPDVGELVRPKQEPTADMVFAPLAVDRSGHAAAAPELAATPAEPAAAPHEAGSGEVMVMQPLAVPLAGTGQGPALPAPTLAPEVAPPAALTADPGVIRVFTSRALRVVLFAAPSDQSSPAYDGIVIERLGPAEAKSSPGASAHRVRTGHH